ncbi:MAG: shikimate dehydrogenase [Mycobacteriaceae bacterium]
MSARKAAVIGTPIEHSRSPQLHLAAYAALGLSDWSYERLECDADGVPALVSSLGQEWVGLSVTMPAKVAALEVADTRTARAEAVGAANTLVHSAHGWLADCTDVDGVLGALGVEGGASLQTERAVVLGAGGTARAVVVALASAGVQAVDLVVRDEARAGGTVRCAERAGLRTRVLTFERSEVARACRDAGVAVNTVPARAAAPLADVLASVPRVLDVIYDPWPTPLGTAVLAAGGRLASGLDMLLHQAYGQVELFTGLPAPREAMAAALK